MTVRRVSPRECDTMWGRESFNTPYVSHTADFTAAVHIERGFISTLPFLKDLANICIGPKATDSEFATIAKSLN